MKSDEWDASDYFEAGWQVIGYVIMAPFLLIVSPFFIVGVIARKCGLKRPDREPDLFP